MIVHNTTDSTLVLQAVHDSRVVSSAIDPHGQTAIEQSLWAALQKNGVVAGWIEAGWVRGEKRSAKGSD